MLAIRLCRVLCVCLLIPAFARFASADPVEEPPPVKPAKKKVMVPAPEAAPTPTPNPTPIPGAVPDPNAPGDPKASADPNAPADSTAPVDPMAPADPMAPVDPMAPADPMAPVDPNAPVTPNATATPEVPAWPETPRTPEADPQEVADPYEMASRHALPLEEAPRVSETKLRLGGLKGGLNAGRFFGKVKGEGVNFGLCLGAFLHLKVSDTLTLQPEFLLTDKGSDVQGVIETMSEALLFVEIPMLLRYDFRRSESLRLYGLAGPSLAYLIDANTVPEEERSRFDMALHAGLGLELPLKNHDVNFEFRGGQGLRNLMRDDSGLTARTTIMSLYAGISL